MNFLPETRDSGGILPWVIAVMMYLCALGLVAALSLNAGVKSWGANLDRRISVQIVDVDRDLAIEKAKQVVAVVGQLQRVRARLLSDVEVRALLEPWLGVGNVSEDLPIPAIVDVIFDPGAEITRDDIELAVINVAPDARVDDHQQWLAQLRDFAHLIEALATLILFLVVMTTVAIVTFGTRARLAAHQAMIDILHLIGAEDHIIADEFGYRFMVYGVRGGVIGLVAALVTLFFLGRIAASVGSGLLPEFQLPLAGMILLGLLPIAAALITMLTARFTVLSQLKTTI
ncbi:MAG: hypothetical protein AAGF15_00235 [Pseudomonadota bacterium]